MQPNTAENHLNAWFLVSVSVITDTVEPQSEQSVTMHWIAIIKPLIYLGAH